MSYDEVKYKMGKIARNWVCEIASYLRQLSYLGNLAIKIAKIELSLATFPLCRFRVVPLAMFIDVFYYILCL